ncbi:MAG TPA: nucleoside 2-deoxyribosyltransferase [Caulobacteraceae bacterium]|jgi:nucleoside 2-deoxyribosyltransferase
MRRIDRVYLAGPQSTLAGADGLLADQRALCLAAGLTPLTAEASGLVEQDPSEAMAREIYTHRMGRLREADAIIANLTPFRGPAADPVTTFEAGFAAGQGKPLFAYLNVANEEEVELAVRIESYEGAEAADDGLWRDGQGYEIEDFGLPESLMLWAEARRLYVIVTPQPKTDLTGLQLCLEAIKLYSD